MSAVSRLVVALTLAAAPVAADDAPLWRGTLGPNELALELDPARAEDATLYVLSQDAGAFRASVERADDGALTLRLPELLATLRVTHEAQADALSVEWTQPQFETTARFEAVDALPLVTERKRVTALGVNPRAPLATAQFAFLVGEWRGVTTRRGPDGGYVETGTITWEGEWILDGRAVQNTAKTLAPGGAVMQWGVDTRVFNTQRGRWEHRYLSGITGDFLALAWQADADGVLVSEPVSWREPDGRLADHVVRIELLDEDHFRWTADVSFDGGASWLRENQVQLNERVRSGADETSPG